MYCVNVFFGVHIGEIQAGERLDLFEKVVNQAGVKLLFRFRAGQRMPVFWKSHSDRLFLFNVRKVVLTELDVDQLIRKIGGIALLGEVWVCLENPPERHIQPVEHLLVVRSGDDVKGLGVVGSHHPEVVAGVTEVAQQQVHFSLFQKKIEISIL